MIQTEMSDRFWRGSKSPITVAIFSLLPAKREKEREEEKKFSVEWRKFIYLV